MSKDQRKLPTCQEPFPAHEWWLEVTRAVGISECADIFSVDQRTIYRWRADGMSAERSTSVMEKFRRLLSVLIMYDRCDLVASGTEYFNSLLTGSQECLGIIPLAKTMHEEINRDFLAVGRLADAIANKEPAAVVESWAQAANEEINRSVAKYKQVQGS